MSETESDFGTHSDEVFSETSIDLEDLSLNKKVEPLIRCLSYEEVEDQQSDLVELVSNILGIDKYVAKILLLYYSWDKEITIEKVYDNNILIKLGVLKPCKPNFDKVEGYCTICCEEGFLRMFDLNCTNSFCIDCHSNYLVQKIKENNQECIFKCPCGCGHVYLESHIEKMVEEGVYKRYKKSLINNYVKCNKNMCFCKGLDCLYIIEITNKNPNYKKHPIPVNCNLGHKFCFDCNLEEEHTPCPCDLASKWIKKIKEDNQTSNWITQNTKECPKCYATIEKNGGCNHMTCKECRNEFCWICLGPWNTHGQNYYSCNKYDESKKHNKTNLLSSNRLSLEKFIHYYNRYINHQQSLDLSNAVYKKIEREMFDLQHSSSLSWIDVQFFNDAAKTLLGCRHTLKWTYAFAYYLNNSNEKHLFEDNQRDFELGVEQLSALIENPEFDKHAALNYRQSVINKTKYVTSRKTILIDDCSKKLQDNIWEFTQNQ